MIRSRLVLPEPEGPEQGHQLARGHGEAHVVHRHEGAEASW